VDPLTAFTASRLAVVAGKGGVGKTTVTAAIVRAAVDAGLRVAAVELDGKSTLASLLPDLPPGSNVVSLTAAAGLSEYLDTHGLRRIARRLASSKVIDVVSTAAPGIEDIVVLGKLKQMERSGDHDLIVVDGPAAGHAINFLLSAASLLDVVESGPIHAQATDVLEMLGDPQRAQVVLVTLAETTPVNETVETAYALEERVGVQLGPVIVNAFDGGPDLDDPAALDGIEATERRWLIAAGTHRTARRQLQRVEVERLAGRLALDQIMLPALPTAILGPDHIAALATSLRSPR
jgi:MinD-like ATPase involved in chromosome partitioning or flagellar assembly